MSDLLWFLFVLAAGFALIGGVTVDGTHYHVGHEDGKGITWHQDKVSK